MAKKRDTLLTENGWWPMLALACWFFSAAFLALIPVFSSGNAWSHGFTHPLQGWDHIITMIAVGIWAAQLRGHAIWLLPLAFVGVMSLGGIAGAAGILLPAVESIILLSCAVFSLLIVRRIRFSNQVNLTIVAFFAFFHGFAHGQEISASASLISYSIGFMLATLLLHGAGILFAKLVLFCATCFFAILLPSLAQAAQQASKGNDNFGSFERLADINQNTSYRQSSNPDYCGSERFVADAFNSTFKNLCADIPDKPDLARHQFKQRTRLISPVQLRTTGQFDQVSAVHSFNNGIDSAAFSEDPLNFSILREVTPNFAAIFKHYFPDINYTPGKILLSNGTGLTSPPLALFANLPHRTNWLFPLFLLFPVEDHALQTICSNSSEILLRLFRPHCSFNFPCVVAVADNAHSLFRLNHTLVLVSQDRDCGYGKILQSFNTI